MFLAAGVVLTTVAIALGLSAAVLAYLPLARPLLTTVQYVALGVSAGAIAHIIAGVFLGVFYRNLLGPAYLVSSAGVTVGAMLLLPPTGALGLRLMDLALSALWTWSALIVGAPLGSPLAERLRVHPIDDVRDWHVAYSLLALLATSALKQWLASLPWGKLS